MCGLNGIASLNKNKEIINIVSRMNDLIFHRGPDDEGLYNDDDCVIMGMRRLSIIDLSSGKQPIFNDDKSLAIVFNGEIYNYKELRTKLISLGVHFKTNSDTEVALRMYESYGVDFINELNGMFAFSIHDKKKNIVLIGRDRFGEKPLYYTKIDNKFIWASELKSIVGEFPSVKEISMEALKLYLSLTYIPAPKTIYKDVFKLQSSSFLILDLKDLSIITKPYWDIFITQNELIDNYSVAKAKLNDLLFESVEKRMVSDVPIGVFLSGGVDSTIIAVLMSKLTSQKVKTFTVGYKDKRYDESARANIVAKHINSEHFECILDFDEIIGDIDKVVLNYDEPYADSSCLPTYFISKKTSDFVKVALSGDGGDEVFGGYNKYLLHTYGQLYQKYLKPIVSSKTILSFLKAFDNGNKDSKSIITKLSKMFDSLGKDTIENHFNIIQLGFRGNSIDKIMKSADGNNVSSFLNTIVNIPLYADSPLKKARYIDLKVSLEGDLLAKVDRASMLTSLECRAPFLDPYLMEFSYQLPDRFLIKGNNKKRLLKDTFSNLLPNNFFNSPKSGFEIPIGSWFKNQLNKDLYDTLSIENLAKHNFFDNNYVLTLLDEHIKSKEDHTVKLWTLFCFQKWYNNAFSV